MRHMRITCSSCSATYDVPDSLLAPGRIVRCARCGTEWAPMEQVPAQQPHDRPESTPEQPSPVAHAPPDAIPEPIPTVQPSAMDRLIAHRVTSPSALGLRIAWAASLVAIVVLLGAAYVWRAQAVAAWPPSARAYALFGMHPANQGNHP